MNTEQAVKRKSIAILGSTGSIGTQALDVISQHPDKFEAYALVANNNVELLIKQARTFQPEVVVICNEEKYIYLKESLKDLPIKVFAGIEAVSDVVAFSDIDIVLTAMVGYAGLSPTIAAIKAGKIIALANKETLVVAGELITKLAQEHQSIVIPVDSEHSAIFQCLSGEQMSQISKIILTASGGPFRTFSMDQLHQVTPEMAMKHPNWDMGAKITVDSASMMNKGLEVIEAKWLFGMDNSQIEIIVHPESIIHSMVEFVDHSIKAQMGLPDMRLPIQYSFSYPERIALETPALNFSDYPSLSFEKPDHKRFRNLDLAYYAMQKGGNMPCILNAANEVAVSSFLQGKIGFMDIPTTIEQTMHASSFVAVPSYEDYVQSNREARQITQDIIAKQ